MTTRRANDSEVAARAAEWLLARGKAPGSYVVGDAVMVADYLAAEEEKARQVASGINWSDDGCDASCSGWDGEDRRCGCGNRRVCWVRGEGHTFESPYVYPEAW